MVYNRVYLPKKLSLEQLEEILKKAAHDMGWTAERKDNYNIAYRLGSLSEFQEHTDSEILIYKKGFLGRQSKQLEIKGFYNPLHNDSFTIWRGFCFGRASEKETKRFLEIVGDYASQQNN